MHYLFTKIRLLFNIIYYTITKPNELTVLDKTTGKLFKEESPLETEKAYGNACEHKNTTKKVFKYELSKIEETFVRCNDCDFTVFAGWRPYESEEE